MNLFKTIVCNLDGVKRKLDQNDSQTIQIMRTTNGKMVCRGLKPGQKLVQNSNGGFEIHETKLVQPKSSQPKLAKTNDGVTQHRKNEQILVTTKPCSSSASTKSNLSESNISKVNIDSPIFLNIIIL